MDIALKQRLVGASVLIALAVVVLPMLLGGRPDQAEQETRKIELPPQPSELNFETRRYPIGDASATMPAASATPDTSGLPAGDSSSPVAADPAPGAVAHVELRPREFVDALEGEPAAEPAAEQAEEAATVEAAEPSEPAEADAAAKQESTPQSVAPAPAAQPPAASGGRYVVQVASFSSIENANRLSDTLRGHGHAVLADTVKSDAGTLYRVRIGPYAGEGEANDAAARLRKQLTDVKPRIVDLQPEAATQVTAPSDPLIRWVVQVGSFSAPGNAETLVARLRGDGLSAYTEAVSASGSTIYRVRVGPYLERDEALRVDRLINERFSLDGVVMSAD